MKRTVGLPARLAAGLLLVVCAACSDGGSSSTPQPSATALRSPVRLADVDATTLLVTDYAAGVFQRIDKSTLQPLSSLHFAGQATGIAAANGLYFVGNRATRSVDVFDDRGTFLYHLGGRTGEFASVNDLAVDASARVVYVLDSKAALVRLFYFDGSDTGLTIGAGILKQPTALTLDDEASTLLVSDFGDPGLPGSSAGDFSEVPPSIWVFDPFWGGQLDVIAGVKSGMGGITTTYFSTPQGLFVDAGYVFVVDALSGEVQVFSLAAGHARVKVLGHLGTGDGELFYPLDVVVDGATKDVFVADNRNGRIAVFRAGGTIP